MNLQFKSAQEALEFWAKYPDGTRRQPKAGLCGIHGDEFVWTSKYGATICGVCHPPVSEDIVHDPPRKP